MIELKNDQLVFSFGEDVHRAARLHVEFQRTLRIPDDDASYPLPPGLGRFPLRHVDDFAARVPGSWLERGGIMLPMYRAEAMWLRFACPEGYPFAVKIAGGKINAVTGEAWENGLHRDPQDYLVAPDQPWLDGFCIEPGEVRQFVAMPLGEGYSAEEQITDKAEWGGLQIIAYPIKREAWERIEAQQRTRMLMTPPVVGGAADFVYAPGAAAAAPMGLAPGGRMKQKIYDDPHAFDDWDLRHKSRCFVHLVAAADWKGITGSAPPHRPPTARQYNNAGLPWFDLYDEDQKAVPGSKVLSALKSVAKLATKKGEPLADNQSVVPEQVVKLRHGLKRDQVREAEGAW